jgi:hypothetical protein
MGFSTLVPLVVGNVVLVAGGPYSCLLPSLHTMQLAIAIYQITTLIEASCIQVGFGFHLPFPSSPSQYSQLQSQVLTPHSTTMFVMLM